MDVAGPIRTQEVTSKVSAVSAVPEVRTRITELQRSIAASAERGIVVEGRDIGTTVLPTPTSRSSSPPPRGARRPPQRRAEGKEATDLAATQAALAKRDAADSGRKTSPLAKADDAVEVDTSELTLQQVVECVVTLVEEKQQAK
ncbi:(d)CMP kinase [Streptomyces sp. M19]